MYNISIIYKKICTLFSLSATTASLRSHSSVALHRTLNSINEFTCSIHNLHIELGKESSTLNYKTK